MKTRLKPYTSRPFKGLAYNRFVSGLYPAYIGLIYL